MGGKYFYVIRQFEEFFEQGIVQFAGEAGWLFLGITQVRPADVAGKEGVAGVNADGLAILANDEAQAVWGVAGSFEHQKLERADGNDIAIARTDAFIGGRGAVGNVDFCAGAAGEFDVAGNEIRMRMSFEDGDDLELLLFGGLKVVLDVAFWINDRRLAARADEVGGMGEALDVEALFKHKLTDRVGAGRTKCNCTWHMA